MKKILSALVVCLSFTTTAMDTVTVNTVQQLVDSIQSNRLILLEPGVYDLSSAPQLEQVDLTDSPLNIPITDHLVYSADIGIIVNQVKNLTMRGLGETRHLNELITGIETDCVLSFSGCSNIKLVNLTVQYDPAKSGNRKGGSWLFSQCTDVHIENNALARGDVGLEVLRSKNVVVTNSTVSECSSGTVQLRESWSVHFSNCTFNNNRACHSMWSMNRCTDVRIENNIFTGNERKGSRKCDTGKMFSVSRCEMLVIKGNTIKGNDFQYLGDSETVRQITADNLVKRNKFTAMVPPQRK